MRKLEWAALAAVVGVVVVAELPRHDHAEAAVHAAAPGMSTVTLAVSGMT